MTKMYRHSKTLADIATFLVTHGFRSKNLHPTADGAVMEVTDLTFGHDYILAIQLIRPPEPRLMLSEVMRAMENTN